MIHVFLLLFGACVAALVFLVIVDALFTVSDDSELFAAPEQVWTEPHQGAQRVTVLTEEAVDWTEADGPHV